MLEGKDGVRPGAYKISVTPRIWKLVLEMGVPLSASRLVMVRDRL